MVEGAQRRTSGLVALFGAATVLGLFGVCARLAEPGFSPTAQTVVRFLLAAGVIAAAGAARGRRLRLARPAVPQVIALGIGTCGLGVLFTLAVSETRVATAVSLLFGASLVTALLVGTVLLAEPLTPAKLAITTLALAGLAVHAAGPGALGAGALAALGAGVTDGACNGLRKRLRAEAHDAVVLGQYVTGALCALPLLLFVDTAPITSPDARSAGALACFGLLSAVLGGLLMYGFARFDVNVGSVILASQVFFAMLLAALLLDEAPAWHEAAGAALIFAAASGAVIASDPRSRERGHDPAAAPGDSVLRSP